jgi:Uma2 family endonuclease
MDSSAARDRRVKLPIYTRGGVREVWLVDLKTATLEVHRRPEASAYRICRVLGRHDSVCPRALPRERFSVRSLIG